MGGECHAASHHEFVEQAILADGLASEGNLTPFQGRGKLRIKEWIIGYIHRICLLKQCLSTIIYFNRSHLLQAE